MKTIQALDVPQLELSQCLVLTFRGNLKGFSGSQHLAEM